MCARKVHPHFTIYHLPCNQNRVRVTSELPRSYLGIVFPHDSRGGDICSELVGEIKM